MDDSPYRSVPWNAADAAKALTSAEQAQIPRLSCEMRAALAPCNRGWLKKRLSVMALAFGHERDPDRATAWLAETGRLLCDLPQDILGDAIDEAIKGSERGFMPMVGQIRTIADPLVEQRRRQVDRLGLMAGTINGGRSRATVYPWEGRATAPEQAEDRPTAAEVDDICKRFGVGRYAKANSGGDPSRPTAVATHADPARPCRAPTREDYIRLGVDPAVLDEIEGNGGEA